MLLVYALLMQENKNMVIDMRVMPLRMGRYVILEYDDVTVIPVHYLSRFVSESIPICTVGDFLREYPVKDVDAIVNDLVLFTRGMHVPAMVDIRNL